MTVRTVLARLGTFTGSEHWYRHDLNKMITYTDGVRYVADKAGAHWLLDKIVACQHEPIVAKEDFQGWKLEVKDGKGKVFCDDGNGKIVYSEAIEYTDFPEPGIELWFTNNVIFLPSEY